MKPIQNGTSSAQVTETQIATQTQSGSQQWAFTIQTGTWLSPLRFKLEHGSVFYELSTRLLTHVFIEPNYLHLLASSSRRTPKNLTHPTKDVL